MIGRESYQNPCFVSQFDKILGYTNLISRRQVIDEYVNLIPKDSHKFRSTAPLVLLFKGKKASTIWK